MTAGAERGVRGIVQVCVCVCAWWGWGAKRGNETERNRGAAAAAAGVGGRVWGFVEVAGAYDGRGGGRMRERQGEASPSNESRG